jgi:hypothetical protein
MGCVSLCLAPWIVAASIAFGWTHKGLFLGIFVSWPRHDLKKQIQTTEQRRNENQKFAHYKFKKLKVKNNWEKRFLKFLKTDLGYWP